VEVAVLEVGLGGRLDAVNTVDADAALVVSIGIDHVDWLGADRDSIGYEKAGIYRPGRPAICADPDPPRRLIDHAKESAHYCSGSAATMASSVPNRPGAGGPLKSGSMAAAAGAGRRSSDR